MNASENGNCVLQGVEGFGRKRENQIGDHMIWKTKQEPGFMGI